MAHLQGEEKTQYVRAMFNRIASRYDLLNNVLSMGMHHRWRALAARTATDGMDVSGGVALDVATGTGDFALALLKRGVERVVGVDFLPSMLALAEAKARKRGALVRVDWVAGDALRLPFPSDSFQWVTSGFNMRNLADLPLSLREMTRVAKPGGRVVILEIVPLPPRGLFPRLFRWYFGSVAPLLGQLFAGDRSAYAYLPASVARFPPAPALARMMEEAGLRDVRFRLLGFGSTAIHVGTKPK
jgi:demethylmenaquinone methyltransferase/2-methoxy-6-polyprenyl-1,4-benzoquinol methylase